MVTRQREGRMTMFGDSTAILTTGLALTLASSLAMSGCGAETPKPKAKTAVDGDQVIGAGRRHRGRPRWRRWQG